MFESSLIDLEARQHSRRKWAPLPIAIALHGAVLVSVGVAQVWNVEAVSEPEELVQFRFCTLPELPPAPSGGGRAKPAEEPKQQTLSQPKADQIPDTPASDPKPDTSTGPIVLDGPLTEGGVGGPDVGPANGPLTVPGSIPTGPAEVVPVSAPPKDEILTVGGAVSRPVLLSGRPPAYPKIPLHARIEGTVVLQAVIDERGLISDLRILRSLHARLDQAAVDSVRDWTFKPATLDGRPVKVYYTLTINFQLQY